MTTHELLEMVTLDALGLLDEDEREEFERAFRAAPPALQAQIRREQSRLARSDALLPHVEPPPGLRARVIAAVREAMQAMAARRGIAGRIVPALIPSRAVAPAWRAAAIGCAAAAVVFAVTTLHMRSQFDVVTDMMKANAQADIIARDFGVRFEATLFGRDTQLVQFAPRDGATGAGSHAKALLLLEGDRTSGQLLIRDLPRDAGDYALNVVDADGNIVGDAVVTFRPTEKFTRIKGLKLQQGQGLAIVPTSSASGKPGALLRSLRS